MERVRGVPVIRPADDEGEFFYVRLQGPYKLHETLWHRDELIALMGAIQGLLKEERKNG